MFEDKRITKEKINNILYSVYNEFNNEISLDVEDFYGKEVTQKEIDFGFWLLQKYIDKMTLVIEDEVEDI